MKNDIPRKEYPRPDFVRENWINLNGIWDFMFDDNLQGEKEHWYKNKPFERHIIVPFCYQSKLSGICDTSFHEAVWYRRTFQLQDSFCKKNILLHFGAVDYSCKVWINGALVGTHNGGHTPFSFDITHALNIGENEITVLVKDSRDCDKPRGKQHWEDKPSGCWYTPTTGIWQTVWLEMVNDQYISKIHITPDIDKRNALMEVYLNKEPDSDLKLLVTVSFQFKLIREIELTLSDKITRVTLDIKEENAVDEVHHWTPETPNLYDVKLKLTQSGEEVDAVSSYFGMRKISVENGMVLLNNRPYIQKLILDQGYWPQSLLAPPSDDAIRFDIEMTLKYGYNGARKHQKIEDPRYYYWADRLGLLVWGEMPSGYQFDFEEVRTITTEWMDFIDRDYNHPCIITWVPFNESWGIRNILVDAQQQAFAKSLYYLTKALDPTRLVSTNDGWECVSPTDICGIHDYAFLPEEIEHKYHDKQDILKKDAQGRFLFALNNYYENQPILLTEYGGIAFKSDHTEEWGYFGSVKDENEFFLRFEKELSAFWKNPYFCGYCYTQLTDVQQEVNGLMTSDRKSKVNVELVRKINESCHRIR